MAPEIFTGLFIPKEKRSAFILAFEEALINSFSIVPLFGPPTKKNLCEIKFDNNGPNRLVMTLPSNLRNAKDFLRKNLHILNETNSTKRKNKEISITNRDTPIIDLSRKVELRKEFIDLTESEPEIIELDESIIEKDRTLTQLDATLTCVIDVDDTGSNREVKCVKRKKDDIQTFVIENNQNHSVPGLIRCSSSDNEVSFAESTFKSNKRKRKFNIDDSGDLSIILEKSRSGSSKKCQLNRALSQDKIVNPISVLTPILENGKRVKKKKRKLQDIDKIQTVSSDSSFSHPPQPLSDGVLQYYTSIDKALNNVTNRVSTVQNITRNQPVGTTKKTKKRKDTLKKKKIRLKQDVKRPINSLTYNQPVHHKIEQNSHDVGESNIFNPSPHVDIEDLRPVAIDGSNVAIGHGKGKFSVKGLKICVDYFFRRGHRVVKVFLPQYRQDCFSTDMLKYLKNKCDMIFTPSTYVNGVRKTSYDDRFIVQYAVEFGGVIVSTDNYRDLLRENLRWKETIEKRLLMLTWADDLLMFPIDPLGRDGPTLDEVLNF